MNYTKLKTKSIKSPPRERKVGYYQKDPNVSTIYIGNLDYKKSEKDIQEIFTKFGNVKYVKVMTDPKTNRSKGFAFVQMPNKKAAELAVSKLNATQMDGRTLKVSIAQERNADKAKIYQTDFKAQAKEEQSEDKIKTHRKRRPKGLKVLFNHLNS